MKLFIGFIALFLLPGSAIAFWDGIMLIVTDPQLLKYLLIGIILGGIVYFLLISRWNHFLTFEHELTHALVALLFFRKINRFVATKDDGGVVYHSGGFGGEFGNIMITLAPYYLPTFAVIALLFQPLIPHKYFSFYIIFIGFTLIFHHLSTFKETINNWTSDTFREAGSDKILVTDIARSGFVFSFVFILTMTLFLNALVFWFMKYSYSGFIPLIKTIFTESAIIFKFILTKIFTIINSIGK